MNIGDRLRNLREKNNLTQEEVGKRIGVAKATVTRYETGEIDIKRTIAIKLGEVLNVSPAYIMGWTDDEKVIDRKEPSEKTDDLSGKIMELFNRLDEKHQEQVIEYARFVLSLDGEEQKS